MFCTQCGTENSAEAGFCQKCGTVLSPVAGQADSKAGTDQSGTAKAIWNPNATANWSFLFTPAFGSYLQMLNWKTLGQPGKAGSAKIWFYISLLVLTAVVAINVITAGNEKAGGAANGLAMLYLFVWYFAAGRGQAKYVKDKLGATYPRRSWLKPLSIGLFSIVGFTAIAAMVTTVVMGQVNKAPLVAKVDGASVVEASDSAPGKLDQALTLVSEKLGTTPECAAAEVKEIITGHYAERLVETGVPDIAMGIARDRIKFQIDMVTEAERNAESQNVQCSGRLMIEFPKEDLIRAAQSEEAKMAQLMAPEFSVPSESVFGAMLTYTVSIPVDKEERKNGPIVNVAMQNNDADGRQLGQYIASYTMLAYATPDVTRSTKNDKKWDKEWKEASVQECRKQPNPEICECRLEHFERVLTQDDMERIGYTLQTNPMMVNKYPNFVAWSEHLTKQCSSVNAAEVVVSPQPVAVLTPPTVTVQPVAAVTQSEPKAAAQAVHDATSKVASLSVAQKTVIEASFDCTKASAKIEKLICSTPETASADKRLSVAYSAARNKTSDDQKLKSEQIQWMKTQRNVCGDSACLLKVTEDRIQTLSLP